MHGILLNAAGLKGAAAAELSRVGGRVLQEHAAAGGDPQLGSVLERSIAAAQKLIPMAPTGCIVEIQVSIQPDPVIGWNASVCVDARSAPTKPRSRRRR